MVGTLGEGLNFGAKFGTKILKETVGKMAPLNNLDQEYFAIKNQVIYNYNNERTREAKNQIVIQNIEVFDINAKNKNELTIMLDGNLFKL